MDIGKRSLLRVLSAFLQKRHYIALKNMLLLYRRPFHNLGRYLSNRGNYPYQITLRTPLGVINPCLYSYHDLQTVNEIFCRGDYFADTSTKVVVDIGSNIGISALYFLTRNPNCKVFLFEPISQNIERLKANLKGFEKRYELKAVAVADFSGEACFLKEDTGRYGGITNNPTPQTIKVTCLHINQILENIASKDKIDILKIDIEGMEERVLNSIDKEILKKVGTIYVETETALTLDGFQAVSYGKIQKFKNLII